MDGRLVKEIFKDGVLASSPQEFIGEYPAPGPAGAAQDLPFTPQELERLKLSGYLQ